LFIIVLVDVLAVEARVLGSFMFFLVGKHYPFRECSIERIVEMHFMVKMIDADDEGSR